MLEDARWRGDGCGLLFGIVGEVLGDTMGERWSVRLIKLVQLIVQAMTTWIINCVSRESFVHY